MYLSFQGASEILFDFEKEAITGITKKDLLQQ